MAEGLDALKDKLERLGVNVRIGDDPLPARRAPVDLPSSSSAQPQQPDARDEAPALRAAQHSARPQRRSSLATNLHPKNRKDVADLLHKIDHIEVAMSAAEALSHAARDSVEAEMLQRSPILQRSSLSPDRIDRPAARKPAPAVARPKPPKAPRASLVSTAMAAAAARPHGGSNAYALSASQQHLQGLPLNSPLSSVLAQYKQAEAGWAHEKARLRRECDEERRRAVKCELELKKGLRLLEHKRLDVKALKSALKNRDAQLAASGERIKELEEALARTQEDSAVRISALNSERDDLKALLMATLQRLEAVDEMVTRADLSSSVMQDKMKALEEERMRALEAAARARAEVQELSESRRKLQWQSKLLEKMSEVQLKHNKHKSEAIRKLLSQPPQAGAGGDDESDVFGQEDSSMLVAEMKNRGY